MAAQLCQKCSPQAPHFFKKFDMIYSKTEKRTPDMSASAKLVSLSAVSCASTSIISLFAIQYSYLIVYQEVIKYPSNIPQRLLYRCERKRVSTWLTSTMSIKGFFGKSTFCSMVEDHIENDFNASTMKLSSAPSCSCNIWVWLTMEYAWKHKHNLTWSNMIKHNQTWSNLCFFSI